MPLPTPSASYDVRDWVTPEDLNVAPSLLGMPLASPGRRLLAITVDVAIVAVLSSLGNLWLVAGLAVIALVHLRAREAIDTPHRKRLLWALAAALLAIGAQQAWVGRGAEPKPDPEMQSEATAVPGLSPVQSGELAELTHEVARLKATQRKPFNLREQLDEWLDDVGLGLGWAVFYFSLLPAAWNGQTVGKRVFGLRVVELTGKPLTVMRAFKRYGGYAAGMATGLLGFAQVFWDPNRQAIQDKTAHTVVIDLRRKLRPVDPPPNATVTEEPR